MKTLSRSVLILAAALCSGAFCQSLKGKDQVMNTGTPEVIDYKGKGSWF